MNGVKRFLGAVTASSEAPPAPPPSQTNGLIPVMQSGPTWPPQSPTSPNESSDSPFSSPKATTAALFHKKDKQRPPPASSFHEGSPKLTGVDKPLPPPMSSPGAGPSFSRTTPSRIVTRKSINSSPDTAYKRTSSRLNVRDELLLSLLASDAVVDSREFEILSSEEVDDLKKEQTLLQSRLEAMQKKLALETKIRDAALSLSKVNASSKKMSKQTDEQLAAATRRLETAQKEWWRVSERAAEVNKRLLEHRAGVLSFSVRNMEKKGAASENGSSQPRNRDSGYETPNRSMSLSPVLNATSIPFDGAHLFAGHADAVVPIPQQSPDRVIKELEAKLKAATDSLSLAGKKQAEMTRELSMVRLEKQEAETMMDFELQNAQDTIAALELEMPKMEQLENDFEQLLEERKAWEMGQLERDEEIRQLRLKMQDLESSSSQAQASDSEIRQMQRDMKQERSIWVKERTQLEEQRVADLARLQEEMDRARTANEVAMDNLSQELEDGLGMLQSFVQKHDIALYSRERSLRALLTSIGTHLEKSGSKVELDSIQHQLDEEVAKREMLSSQLDDARRERDDARKEAVSLAAKLKEAQFDFSLRTPIKPSAMFPAEFTGDAAKIVEVLQPLWAMLPSPEQRAAKFNAQRFRTGSPTPSSPGSGASKSLADLDVRSLKTLYGANGATTTNPSTPIAPNNTAFTVEGFSARVQALILDDRSLIERLVRFAQAHDLLKKNAERAQKLAQDGSTALETYQKQVRMLEDRNMSLSQRYATMEEHIRDLEASIDQITAEKLEIEAHAAEQAGACRQLSEANDTLSARTLTLAEEAATASELIKKQLEAQLSESRAALQEAQERLEAISVSEQNQKVALLDELNTMQTENGQLRAQLRALKK